MTLNEWKMDGRYDAGSEINKAAVYAIAEHVVNNLKWDADREEVLPAL